MAYTISPGRMDGEFIIVNISLKEIAIPCLFRKSSLDPTILHNCRQVSNLSFLSKVIEKVLAAQVQEVLEETDFLGLYQSSFRQSFEPETALVALVDDLHCRPDSGSASFLVLLDLSVAFIDHGVFLG